MGLLPQTLLKYLKLGFCPFGFGPLADSFQIYILGLRNH